CLDVRAHDVVRPEVARERAEDDTGALDGHLGADRPLVPRRRRAVVADEEAVPEGDAGGRAEAGVDGEPRTRVEADVADQPGEVVELVGLGVVEAAVAGVEGAAEADGEGAAAVGALHRHGRAPARAEVGRGGVGGGVPPGPGERRDRGLQRVVRGAEGHALRRDRRSGGGGEEGEVGEEAGAAHGRRGGAAETNEGRRGAPPLPSGAGERRKGRGSLYRLATWVTVSPHKIGYTSESRSRPSSNP